MPVTAVVVSSWLSVSLPTVVTFTATVMLEGGLGVVLELISVMLRLVVVVMSASVVGLFASVTLGWISSGVVVVVVSVILILRERSCHCPSSVRMFQWRTK